MTSTSPPVKRLTPKQWRNFVIAIIIALLAIVFSKIMVDRAMQASRDKVNNENPTGYEMCVALGNKHCIPGPRDPGYIPYHVPTTEAPAQQGNENCYNDDGSPTGLC